MDRPFCLRPSIHRLALSMGRIARSDDSREADCLQRRRLRGTEPCRSYPRVDSSNLISTPTKSSGSSLEIVHAESLGKNLTSKWRIFKSPLADLEHINRAAHWNYQRDRVFVRSGTGQERLRHDDLGHAGPSRKPRRWSFSRLRPPARNAANEDGEKVGYFPEPCRTWSSAGAA